MGLSTKDTARGRGSALFPEMGITSAHPFTSSVAVEDAQLTRLSGDLNAPVEKLDLRGRAVELSGACVISAFKRVGFPSVLKLLDLGRIAMLSLPRVELVPTLLDLGRVGVAAPQSPTMGILVDKAEAVVAELMLGAEDERFRLSRFTSWSGGGENFSFSLRSRSFRFSSFFALRRAIRATSRARMR